MSIRKMVVEQRRKERETKKEGGTSLCLLVLQWIERWTVEIDLNEVYVYFFSSFFFFWETGQNVF